MTPPGCDCAHCPFAKDGRPSAFVPVIGEGPARPKGILLADSPSDDDAQCGRPYSGATGRALDDVLHGAGLPRAQVWVTFSTACPRPEGAGDKDMRAAVRACAGRVKEQLARFPNAPALAMGKWASLAVTGREYNLQKARGFVREIPSIPRAK